MTPPRPDERDRVFELAAELFGVLSAPVRLHIVCALAKGELNVGQLQAQVDAAQSNLSQHLATLYRCGLVQRRRVGTQVLYRVDDPRVALLCAAVQERQAAGMTPPARPDEGASSDA